MPLYTKTSNRRFRPATDDEIITAAKEILWRRLEGRYIKSPKEAADFIRAALHGRHDEVFCVLYLDNQHRVLAFDEAFQGTITGTAVYPRTIVRRALELNAAAVIFAHNHPSGVAEPSLTDRALTDRLRETLALVEVRVLDHIVVGCGEFVSFSERGWL